MTRNEYLDSTDPNAHFAYYSQFVTESVRLAVLSQIGLTRLLASKDPSFNDIPLRNWDWLPSLSFMDRAIRAKGDVHGLTPCTKVCIYKQAARMLVAEHRAASAT